MHGGSTRNFLQRTVFTREAAGKHADSGPILSKKLGSYESVMAVERRDRYWYAACIEASALALAQVSRELIQLGPRDVQTFRVRGPEEREGVDELAQHGGQAGQLGEDGRLRSKLTPRPPECAGRPIGEGPAPQVRE